MADQEQEEISSEEAKNFGFWDNNPLTVPEHYIKVSEMTNTPSDVTLLLGNTYWEGRGRIDLCKLRLIMPHSDFLEFAEEVQKQATFLKKIYKGDTPGPNATPEEIDTALEEVYGDD